MTDERLRHSAENDRPIPYDPTDPDEAEFLGIPMPASAENDATCPRCGQHRPHGCLCHIPIPKRYTREDMERAFEAGCERALEGVWYADVTTPFEPAMFTEWLTRVLSPGSGDTEGAS